MSTITARPNFKAGEGVIPYYALVGVLSGNTRERQY
jgi:hypothetical protein